MRGKSNSRYKKTKKCVFLSAVLSFGGVFGVLNPHNTVQAESAYSGESVVNAVVRDAMLVGVSDDIVRFSLTPTTNGTFDSKTVDVHIYTNSSGYNLYISAEDEAHTSLNHVDPTIESKFNPLTSVIDNSDGTGANFPSNYWGYSIDSGVNYRGISTDFVVVGGRDSLRTATHDVYSVDFGVKVNAGMTAGTYNSTVIFTLTAERVPISAPVIAGNGDSEAGKWVSSATVKAAVETDSEFGTDYYDYYVTQTSEVPTETTTPTGQAKDVTISNAAGYADGIYNVFFRAVDKEGEKSDWSNVTVVKLDGTAPTGSYSATNTAQATAQTATLTCADANGVTGYSLSAGEPDTYTAVNSVNWTGTQQITAPGEYSLYCRDEAGNVGVVAGDTFNSYSVNSVLNKVSESTGMYTSDNYAQAANTDTYIVKHGTTVNPAALQIVPTGSSLANYKGSSFRFDNLPAAMETGDFTITKNGAIYSYFNRNMVELRVQAGTGVASVTGAGTFKYGATAKINATLRNNYTWSKWTRDTASGAEFSTTQNHSFVITESMTLVANAEDKVAPVVTSPVAAAYNTLSFTMSDDIGVTDYCVTTESNANNCTWNSLGSAQTSSTVQYDIANATGYSATEGKTYHVFARDAFNNISADKSLASYVVSRSQGAGSTLVVRYDSTGSESGSAMRTNSIVALRGTKLYASASPQADYTIRTLTLNTENKLSDMGGFGSSVSGDMAFVTTASWTTLDDLTYMQDITSGVCTHSTANNDKVYNLIDRRINYTSNKMFSYRVKKLTDGHCWMNQNLAIEGQTTLSSTYSNLPHSNVANNYTLPVSDQSIENRWEVGTVNGQYMWNASHTDNTIDSSSNRGAFYSWTVATAMTMTDSSITEFTSNTYDICPAGWRLPRSHTTSGVRDEAFNISGNEATYKDVWNMTRDVQHCNAYNGIGCPSGTQHWWTGTYAGSNLAYSYAVRVDGVDGFFDGSWSNLYGFSVRCVAK